MRFPYGVFAISDVFGGGLAFTHNPPDLCRSDLSGMDPTRSREDHTMSRELYRAPNAVCTEAGRSSAGKIQRLSPCPFCRCTYPRLKRETHCGLSGLRSSSKVRFQSEMTGIVTDVIIGFHLTTLPSMFHFMQTFDSSIDCATSLGEF